MKRFVAALAWKRSADEKIPLSTKKHVPDNGATGKLSPSEQAMGKVEKEKMADDKATEPKIPSPDLEPMSLLRKFFMFLSLNVIALYFMAFAILIPCRILNCQSKREWTVDLNNINISTNLEITGPPGLELLLFGYLEGSFKGVSALNNSMGTLKWEVSLNFSPVYCRCNVDVNGDGVKDCLIFGETRLLALNASNGHVFWTRKFGTITPTFATISGCGDQMSELIIFAENRRSVIEEVHGQLQDGRVGMVILDSKNGTVVNYFPLHCDSFPKQLVTWISRTNLTYLAFQCSYNNTTDVQLISEEDLCNLVFGKSVPKIRGFSRLFSFGSSTAVDDVLLLPVSHVGLIVGWSTMIAMATDVRNPARLLWQATSGSIRSAIKSVLSGHFTSKNSTQIAVALQDDSSNLVKVVDVLNGSEVASVELGPGELLSIFPIYRMRNNSDSLVIIKDGAISSIRNGTGSDIVDSTAENAFVANTSDVSRRVKTYLLLTFGKENNVTELLKENRRTEVAVKNGNCIAIFFATCVSNQTTRISSRDLDFNSKTSCSCT